MWVMKNGELRVQLKVAGRFAPAELTIRIQELEFILSSVRVRDRRSVRKESALLLSKLRAASGREPLNKGL